MGYACGSSGLAILRVCVCCEDSGQVTSKVCVYFEGSVPVISRVCVYFEDSVQVTEMVCVYFEDSALVTWTVYVSLDTPSHKNDRGCSLVPRDSRRHLVMMLVRCLRTLGGDSVDTLWAQPWSALGCSLLPSYVVSCHVL